jgi:hypothetical protein
LWIHVHIETEVSEKGRNTGAEREREKERERERERGTRREGIERGRALYGCGLDRGDSECALFTDEEQQAADMEAKGRGMPQGNTHFTRNTLHQTRMHSHTHLTLTLNQRQLNRCLDSKGNNMI